ncbi:MAG: hypothetical protein U9N01_05220 [Euryarchaeota archaeon]|nr:hypothetical protein [Euryarchaeota archaeon]
MTVETEAASYDPHSVKKPSALSEEARAALREFGEKHRELIENADLLPQPMRSIAQFVKKEVGGEWKGKGKEDEQD